MPTNGDLSQDGKKKFYNGAWIYESATTPPASAADVAALQASQAVQDQLIAANATKAELAAIQAEVDSLNPVASVTRNTSGHLVITLDDGSSTTLPDSLQTQDNKGEIENLKLFDTAITQEVQTLQSEKADRSDLSSIQTLADDNKSRLDAGEVSIATLFADKADKTELHDPVTLAAGSDPALQLINQSLKLTLPPQVDITRADAVATLPDVAAAEAGVAYVVSGDGAYMLNGAGDALVKIADLTVQDGSLNHYYPSYEGAGGGNGAVIPALDVIVIGGTGNEAGSWINTSGGDAAFATNSLSFRRLTGAEEGLKEWDAAETVPVGEFRTYGPEIYYSIQESTGIVPIGDDGSNWRNVSGSTTDAYSIASDGFADRNGGWDSFVGNVSFDKVYALRMLDAGTFDFNDDGNPLTVEADDAIIYLYDRWVKYGSSSVLADKSVNEGTVYNVEDYLTQDGEIWFKTTSGEKESIQFQTASAAITFRARFENKQVAFAPNAPVTLSGSAWRAKREGNLITIFELSSGQIVSTRGLLSGQMKTTSNSNLSWTGDTFAFPLSAYEGDFGYNSSNGYWTLPAGKYMAHASFSFVNIESNEFCDYRWEKQDGTVLGNTAVQLGSGFSGWTDNPNSFAIFELTEETLVRCRVSNLSGAFNSQGYRASQWIMQIDRPESWVRKDEVTPAEDSVVTLIDVDAVNNTLYNFSTGETWAEIKANYDLLIFTGNASQSGSPNVRPYSKILTPNNIQDIADNGGGIVRLEDSLNSVDVWINNVNDAHTGFTYRQSSGDAPTLGRMSFTVVGLKKVKTALGSAETQAGYSQVSSAGTNVTDVTFATPFDDSPIVNVSAVWNYNAATNGSLTNRGIILDGQPTTTGFRVRGVGDVNALDGFTWIATPSTQ